MKWSEKIQCGCVEGRKCYKGVVILQEEVVTKKKISGGDVKGERGWELRITGKRKESVGKVTRTLVNPWRKV